MKASEFKNLINFIDVITLVDDSSGFYEIWFSGKNNDAFLRQYGLVLRTARNDLKTYKSIDKAVLYLRSHGWIGTIQIKQPF